MEETIERIKKTYTKGIINALAVEELSKRIEVYLNSESEEVRNIASNLDRLKDIEPSFKITSSSDKTSYSKDSKELGIKAGSEIDLDRAIGEVLVDMTSVPLEDEIKKFIQDARVSCVREENLSKFGEYLNSICDEEKEDRTSFETGPISDIICSVFQYPVLTVGGKRYILPSNVKKPSYVDLERGGLDTRKIFAENFANYFTLIVNGRSLDLDILKEFLGESWSEFLDKHLAQVSSKLKGLNADMDAEAEAKKF